MFAPNEDNTIETRRELDGDPLIGTVIDRRYEIREAIDEGRAYRARQVAIDRDVALTVIDAIGATERTVARFLEDARALSHLRHPSTITLHDFGTLPDGRLFVAMEYVMGPRLSEVIREGSVPVPRALRIASEIAGALEEAHRADVVHGHLAPVHIRIDTLPGRGDFARLVDFGIARLGDDEHCVMGTGSSSGMTAYLPPEQCCGEPTSAASDIYALGLVIFEMIAGALPRQASIPMPRVSSRAPVGSVPLALDVLVDRMLARSPDDRPADMGVVREALEAIECALEGLVDAEDGRAAAEWNQPSPAPDRAPRWPWLAAGLLAGFAAIAATWVHGG